MLTLTSCVPGLPTPSTTTDGGSPAVTTTGATPILRPDGTEVPALTAPALDLDSIPEYTGTPYAVVNGNVPSFTSAQCTTESYEFYSDLDALGRCGLTVACVGIDIMPTEDRGAIGSVKPSGWQSVRYDIVDGKYLYNRCHLIGFQLTGENANRKNLITGTRYMNVDGMLPFENMVADYVKETENHVMLRVIPLYKGNELVARGVLMEAYSVEDQGDGISFSVFVYNVQPGISINYATGESWLNGEDPIITPTDPDPIVGGNEDGGEELDYVLNTNTKKFHDPDCSSAKSTKESNKQNYRGTSQSLIDSGYEPCGVCKP
ncbi:MAG: DNA/RNA non-specific endonuclease [Clostridia bacterium]|nr:DNA/RNA non-specific endonuclease [Clostridia bacterium]